MANEFYYSVSLSIVHPTVDPKSITRSMTPLSPSIETMAGTEKRTKDGALIIPVRKAALSHWLAELHDEDRLFSGDKPIDDFLLDELKKLEEHRELFRQLQQEGRVALLIGLFSISNYSAFRLGAGTLFQAGDLGIDLEFNFYGV